MTERRNSGPKANGTPEPKAPDLARLAQGVVRMQASFARGLLQQEHELVDFIARRIDADLKLMDRLAAADDPGDLGRNYMAFSQRAMEDYSDLVRARLGVFLAMPAALVQLAQDQAQNALNHGPKSPVAAGSPTAS